MLRLRETARLVEAVYSEMAETYANYQRQSGLHCRNECGECCLHPGIEASVLEMLPLAFSLFDQGKAEQTLAQLEEYSGEGCFFYQKRSFDGKQGFCGVYDKRPSICRLFGVAGYRNKHGEAELSVCKVIKHDHTEKYREHLITLSSETPPMIRDGKEMVRQIDYTLGADNLPILDATKRAIEKVLFNAYYSGDFSNDNLTA